MTDNKDVNVTDDIFKALSDIFGKEEAELLLKGEGVAHESKESKKEEAKEKSKGDKDEVGDKDEAPDTDDDDELDKEDEDEEEVVKAKKKEDFKKAKEELDGIKKSYKTKKQEIMKSFPDMFSSEKEGSKADKKEDKQEKEIKKSEISTLTAELIQPLNDELVSKFDSFAVITKSILSENNDLKKSLAEVTETLNKVSQVVTQIGNQSIGRKSAGNVNFLEKSFGNGETIEKGKTTMSLSKDKEVLESTLLTLSGIEKGQFNEFYGNAATLLNTSGSLNKAIENDLYTNHNIRVVE